MPSTEVPTQLKPTHTLTIISSTKIQKKVTQTLTLLFPGDASAEDTANYLRDREAGDSDKPILIEITAKSSVASKLITIVEIVKREAGVRLKTRRADVAVVRDSGTEGAESGEGAGGEGDGVKVGNRDGTKGRKATPRLWQYTSLSSTAAVPKGPPPKKRKFPDPSEDSVHDADAANDGDVAMNAPANDDDDDDDNFFETLEPATKRLVAAAAPERFAATPRMVPVLRVVLSWRRLEGLRREGWGEQGVG